MVCPHGDLLLVLATANLGSKRLADWRTWIGALGTAAA